MSQEAPKEPAVQPSLGWGQLLDARGIIACLDRRIDRMGPLGKRLSLIIPVIVLVVVVGGFLKGLFDYLDVVEKITAPIYARWVGSDEVTVQVIEPVGISATVIVTRGNEEIARKSAKSGAAPVIFTLVRNRSYSITVTSDHTYPSSKDLRIERSTATQQCTIKLAWLRDRRPIEATKFDCAPSTTATSAPDPFEIRIDKLEQSLVATGIVLTQSRFETGSSDPQEADGLASFQDNGSFVELSFGALQWSLRGCTLPPVLRGLQRHAPDAFRDAFGPGDAFLTWIGSMKEGCPEMRSDQTTARLRAAFSGIFYTVWKPRFARLGTDPRIQAFEAYEARRLLSSAVREADCFGLHSKRALAVLFTIIVTAGPQAIDRIWQDFEPAGETEEPRLAALVTAIKSRGGLLEAMTGRQLPAMLGQGEPHSLDLGLSRFEPPGEPSACSRTPHN